MYSIIKYGYKCQKGEEKAKQKCWVLSRANWILHGRANQKIRLQQNYTFHALYLYTCTVLILYEFSFIARANAFKLLLAFSYRLALIFFFFFLSLIFRALVISIIIIITKVRFCKLKNERGKNFYWKIIAYFIVSYQFKEVPTIKNYLFL